MKSRLILLLLTCLFSGIIYAQDGGQNSGQDRRERQQLTIEGRVNMQSERMKRDFDLTDAQYDSVKKINLKYAQKNDEALKNSSDDAAKRREILEKNQEAQNKELKAIFTESQYKKYEEQLKNRRERGDRRDQQGQRPSRNENRGQGQRPPRNN